MEAIREEEVKLRGVFLIFYNHNRALLHSVYQQRKIIITF